MEGYVDALFQRQKFVTEFWLDILNQQRHAVNAQTLRLTGQTYDRFYSSNRTAVATVAYQEIKDLDGPNVEKFISQVRTSSAQQFGAHQTDPQPNWDPSIVS